MLADAAQLHDRGLGAVGEVGIAVAELLREVELEPLGELDGARDRVAVVGEALEHVGGAARTDSWLPRRSRSQPSSEVRQRIATSTSCSAARRASCACTSPVATVCTLQRLGEIAQRCVAARVAALVRTLELDEEAVAAEGVGEPRGRVRVVHGEPVAGAAGEADEPVVQLLEPALVERRRQRLASLASAACARARAVSSRQRFA